jgi:hypothetical protein
VYVDNLQLLANTPAPRHDVFDGHDEFNPARRSLLLEQSLERKHLMLLEVIIPLDEPHRGAGMVGKVLVE